MSFNMESFVKIGRERIEMKFIVPKFNKSVNKGHEYLRLKVGVEFIKQNRRLKLIKARYVVVPVILRTMTCEEKSLKPRKRKSIDIIGQLYLPRRQVFSFRVWSSILRLNRTGVESLVKVCQNLVAAVQ